MAISNLSSGLRPGVCTSTTRPTAPYEGFLIYETDTDMVAIWNGTAWRYIAATTPTNGTVLQVVSTTKDDTFSTSSTSFTDVTGLSASITPKSSSSKVLVTVNIGHSVNSANSTYYNIVRGSTNIAQPSGGTTKATMIGLSQDVSRNISMTHLDSPSTTSSTTYKVQMRTFGGTAYVNRWSSDANLTFVSSITLMEIAG